ncbi:MAG TPA: hypothetical protein VF121_05125 [Thermoanaerobaculia bacterium]|nr:hypothetical protein [Thermoanaerobaculia bacterium]
MADKTDKRGSTELRRRLDQPVELSGEQLKNLVAAAEATSSRILNWEVYGKPGIDRLKASFSIGPDELPNFVKQLVANRARFGWEVFPEGVPPFIDQFRVDLKQGF